ncbi:hypothetical protein GCM10009038_31330 [Salinicola rhizosphaerae]|uniref:Uncharacterized protein n=1 Tax=Salinicola rhizosphaerae TaxID=1443141 RepID=A0ABQ3EAL4_9GAMM|nr:hypothetical protein GCM10009038_31330 [Salinicola rhizosphaerae]
MELNRLLMLGSQLPLRGQLLIMWRDSAVEYIQSAVVHLDPGDLFAREPYLAESRDKDTDDTIAAECTRSEHCRERLI